MTNDNKNGGSRTGGAFYSDCVVSRSADGSQSIFSDDRQVRALDGDGALELAARFRASLRGRIAWEKPVVFSDSASVSPGAVWTTEEDLAGAAAPAQTHPYLLMTSKVNPFLSFLLGNTGAYTPVILYGRSLIMGPRVSGAIDTCPACFALSLLTNIPSLAMRFENEHEIDLPPENLRRCVSALEALVAVRESDTPKYPAQGVLTFDLLTGEVSSEERAVTLCGRCAEGGAPVFGPRLTGPQAVRGTFAGLVQNLHKVKARPRTLGIFVSSGHQLQQHQLGGGVHLDRELAKKKAVFETIERFTQSRLEPKARLAAISELAQPATPEDFTLFTDEQYAAPGMRYSRFDGGKKYYWLEGTRLASRQPLSLPADFIGIDYTIGRNNNLCPLKSSGAAAHETFNKALTNACIELLERDVVSRTWFKGAAGELDAALWAPVLKERLFDEGLETRLWLSDDTSCGPVVVGAIIDRETGLGALGSSSGLNLSDAATSAVYNAATMFAHREQTGRLLPLGYLGGLRMKPAVKDLDDIPFRLGAFVKKYDPACFDLTDQHLRRAGLHVVSVWSPLAVDFPNSSEPLPLRKWRPDAGELARLDKEISHISGK